MTIKDVAERLLAPDLNGAELPDLAAAIESHRCVDAESVRALAKEWDKRSDDLLVSRDKYDLGKAIVYQYAAIQVRALLPPQPTALKRAIAMVENSSPSMRREIEWPGPLLALLKEAQAERK